MFRRSFSLMKCFSTFLNFSSLTTLLLMRMQSHLAGGQTWGDQTRTRDAAYLSTRWGDVKRAVWMP